MARLRDAIACEPHAQLAMRRERIELEDVPEAAYAVAMRLRQAFAIRWSPRWQDADPDDDGSLGVDAAVFHASSPPTDRYPIFDHDWPPPLTPDRPTTASDSSCAAP